MIVALVVIVIAVLLARLDIKNVSNINYGLISSFIVLTIFSSIRYNYGNDYPNYLQFFIDINGIRSVDLSAYREMIGGMEWGWMLLNRLCEPIGFFGMIIGLTCLEYTIIYKFITRYLERKYYWLAVLIFGMSFGLMITGVSMMRQFLAQCLCLIAFRCVINRKLIIAILFVLLATTIHTSAWIIIPICFVGYYYKILKNKYFVFILMGILMVLYLFGKSLLGGVFDSVMLMNEDFERYDVYVGQEELNLGFVGILRTIYDLMFIGIVIFQGRRLMHRERLILVTIYLFSYLIDGFSNVVPLIGRLGYYFDMVGIVVLPMVFSMFRNKIWRILIPVSYTARITYGWVTAFYSEVWYDAFFEYHTIFEVGHWM